VRKRERERCFLFFFFLPCHPPPFLCSYGALPCVRATGGLRDTVFDVDHDHGRAAWEVAGSTDAAADGPGCTNGWSFEGTDAGALDSALDRALDAYWTSRDWFRATQARVARQDWSWAAPALDYVQIYREAAGS